MKTLIVCRISRQTDASTAVEKQLAECRRYIQAKGWTEVGVATDSDTSARSTRPFDRPALSEWIGDGKGALGRLSEIENIIVWRFDRLIRRVADLSLMIDWLTPHKVNLCSVTESFDLSTPMGRAIAQIISALGELEVESMAARNANAFQHNYRLGKWRGGVPAWGLLPSNESGEWRLVHDEDVVAEIKAVVSQVLAGVPMRVVAQQLNERGVLTQRDRFAQVQGRDVKGYRWYSSGLRRALSSVTLLGQAETAGELVRSPDGSPLVRSEPILTRQQFDQLQAELASRENRKEPTKRSNSLLLGIIFCACGEPMYRLKGGEGRVPRYRCKSVQSGAGCGGRSVQQPQADAVVENLLDALLGGGERRERVWVAGPDMAELEDVNATLTDLTGLLGSGVYRAGTPQREALDTRIAALADRQQQLQQEAPQETGWQYSGTGQRWSEWFTGLSLTEKNVWLRQAGVRLVVEPAGWGFEVGDLPQLVSGVDGSAAQQWGAVLAEISTADLAGVEIGVDGSAQLHARRC